MGAAAMPLAGAGLGAAKYWGIERPRENRQRNLAAQSAYYGNYLGQSPSESVAMVGGLPKEGSVWENMLGGAGRGDAAQGGKGMQSMFGGAEGGANPMEGAQDISGGGSAGGMAGSPWESLLQGGGGGAAGALPFIPV